MLGDCLRELRQQHQLTLRELAQRAELSTALLSQLENGHSDPSVATLRKLARVFDAELADLFRDADAPSVYVSRPGKRFTMAAPEGLIAYERLTPGRGDLEVLRADLAPGDVSSQEPWAHPSTEVTYVLAGQVVVSVAGTDHPLSAGEAITFDSRQPHRYANTSTEMASILISVTPPTP